MDRDKQVRTSVWVAMQERCSLFFASRSRLRVMGIVLIASWALLAVINEMRVESVELPSRVEVLLFILLPITLLIGGLCVFLSTAEGFDGRQEMSLRRMALVRIVVTLIAVAVVVQSISFGFPTIDGNPPDPVQMILNGVYLLAMGTAVMAFILSLALAWRAVEQPDARALALFMGFLALYWGPLLNIIQLGHTFTPGEPNPNSLNLSISSDGLGGISIAALFLSVAAFLRFSALFPRVLKQEDFQVSRLLRPLRAIRAKLLNPAIVWGVFGGMAIPFIIPNSGDDSGEGVDISGFEAEPWMIAVLIGLLLLWIGLPLLGMIIGALNLRAGYLSSVASERKRILWVVAGCVISTCMVLLGLLTPFLPELPGRVDIGFPALLLLAPLVLVVCLGVSVFYKGEIHPALVINRATVYGVLGIFMVALFSTAESLLSEVLENALGFSSLASSASLGGLVAVLLIPLRPILARWFGGWLPTAEVQMGSDTAQS